MGRPRKPEAPKFSDPVSVVLHEIRQLRSEFSAVCASVAACQERLDRACGQMKYHSQTSPGTVRALKARVKELEILLSDDLESSMGKAKKAIKEGW